MQQLRALDAVFLSMETPSTPSHIGGLAILDPSTSPASFDYDSFRAFVRDRVGLCPRFCWKIQEVPFGLDLPYWVDDGSFDVADHVRRIAVPGPGGPQELAELTSYLFERTLDRDRPLWEMFFIEGLQGGRKALLWKLHHCLMDGVSGAGLAELLFDLGPEPADRPLVPTDESATAGQRVEWLDMARQGLENAGRRPLALARHLGTALRSLAAPSRDGNAGEVPRVGFNGVVGPRRAVAWSSVSLSEVTGVKEEFGVTVNDVVLALTSGAVRRYLDEQEGIPAESLHAIVPVSTRSNGDTRVGNNISQMSLPWRTDLAEPVERLLAIAHESRRAKHSAGHEGLNLMAAMGEGVAPVVLRLLTRAAAAAPALAPLPGNAVVSNVRGTPFPIYMAGAKVESMVPISLLAPGQGLNITVVSYEDTLHFGITVDPELLAEPWVLADAIPKALTELQAAI